MAFHEHIDRRDIIIGIDLAGGLARGHHRQRFRGQLGAKRIHAGDAFSRAGRATVEHETFQSVRMGDRVFKTEKTAPGLSDHMHLAEIERGAEDLDFFGEAGHVVEREIVRLVGAARSELGRI